MAYKRRFGCAKSVVGACSLKVVIFLPLNINDGVNARTLYAISMKSSILSGKYILEWKCKSETGFAAVLWHFNKNSSGGGIQTPIGTLVGLLNEHPYYWDIKIILRNDINYNPSINSISVIVKSAYLDKLKYYLDVLKLKTAKSLPLDANFKIALVDFLISENICKEPLSLYLGKENILEYSNRGSLTPDDFD